jgi:hypothetical protein
MGRAWFAWAPRTDGIEDWPEEVRYDRYGRGVVNEAAQKLAAEKDLDLLDSRPVSSYVFKRRTTDAWEPCSDTTDGAVPSWIWYAR